MNKRRRGILGKEDWRREGEGRGEKRREYWKGKEEEKNRTEDRSEEEYSIRYNNSNIIYNNIIYNNIIYNNSICICIIYNSI